MKMESAVIAASIMGKLASNPGMFWILCASHKQFNLLASIVKKRMRKPWGTERQRLEGNLSQSRP